MNESSICMQYEDPNADTSVCSSTCKRVCVRVSRERQRHRDSVCYRCIRVPGTVGCVSYVALVLKGLQ